MATYPGPLADEPLSVELHNTIYVAHGKLHDGLETAAGLDAWLAGIAGRIPAQARQADASRLSEFLTLRGVVRDALEATVKGRRIPDSSLLAINAAAAAAPHSLELIVGEETQPQAQTRYHGADPTEITLAALATDAIDVIGGDRREKLHACGAPGCVLIFLQDHPRRKWCSEACGNRARQARHYAHTRRARR